MECIYAGLDGEAGKQTVVMIPLTALILIAAIGPQDRLVELPVVFCRYASETFVTTTACPEGATQISECEFNAIRAVQRRRR